MTEIRRDGVYNEIYCCKAMCDEAGKKCRHHPDGCPDRAMSYEVVSGGSGREIRATIRDGYNDIPIKFCPFCGLELDRLSGPFIGFEFCKPA